MSDEEVVRRVQEGDKDAFGEIVERYEDKIRRYVLRLTGGGEEVDDLVQEVFVSAYVNIQGFDTAKKFSSWIYRIAHNKVVDYFKKIRPQSLDNEDWLPENKKLIEEVLIEKEEKERVWRAVMELELKYREVIILYYFEEKSYEEIGDILHLSVSNVGVTLCRAKKKLKELF